MSKESMPQFQQAQNVLDHESLLLTPCALHGFMSGILAVDSNIPLTDALEQFSDENVSLDSQLLAKKQRLRELLEHMYNTIHHCLNSTEFDFQLLLPEEAALQIRLQALAEWSELFLFAVGIASAKKHMPAELVRDIVAISRIDTNNTQQSEETELHYHEITEFLRMSVINIHSEFHSKA